MDVKWRGGWSASPGVLAAKLAARETLSQPRVFRKIDGLRKRISSSLPPLHSFRQNELCASVTQEAFEPHREKPCLLVYHSGNAVPDCRLQPKPLLLKSIPLFPPPIAHLRDQNAGSFVQRYHFSPLKGNKITQPVFAKQQ